jgi:hypothetical protein
LSLDTYLLISDLLTEVLEHEPEVCKSVKRDLIYRQKRPIKEPKEAYICIPLSKRGLRLQTSLQKKPTFAYLSPKEAYVAYLSIKEPKEVYICIPMRHRG